MIYLDNNATTMVDPAVVEAMLPYLRGGYGNPSSVHRFGQESRQAVEAARVQVAGLLGVQAREVVFTSGGTEGNNAAILGVLEGLAMRGGEVPRKVVISAVEHSAVREPAEHLRGKGYEVAVVGVDRGGRLDMDALKAVLAGGGVAVVSVMWANNETGVLFDVEAVGKLCREKGVAFHCDAVQAAGKVVMRVGELPIDLLTVSAHKLHGPKGVGALYVRRGVRWAPVMHGGPQERDRRGGTENVAGIVGFGKAAELAQAAVMDADVMGRIAGLRDRLERVILERVPDAHVNGDVGNRVANTTNIGFAGLEAEAILLLLSEQEICASAGAACSSGSLEPSPILRAMGVPERVAHGSVRLSLSKFSTESDVAGVLAVLPGVVARLRAVMPG